MERFVKLSENAVINLESMRHRLNTAKECLECKITDNVCFVSAETYESTKNNTLKTVNAGNLFKARGRASIFYLLFIFSSSSSSSSSSSFLLLLFLNDFD